MTLTISFTPSMSDQPWLGLTLPPWRINGRVNRIRNPRGFLVPTALAVVSTLLATGCTGGGRVVYRYKPLPLGGPGIEQIAVRRPAGEVKVAGGLVWVLESTPADRYFVDRVDPRTRHVIGRPFPIVGPLVSDIAVGRGGVWLSMPTLTGPSWDKEPGFVRRLDPQSGKVESVIEVGHHPGGITVGGGSVWVSNTVDDSVTRIDPTKLWVNRSASKTAQVSWRLGRARRG